MSTTYKKSDIGKLIGTLNRLRLAYNALDALPQVDNDLLNEMLQLATANTYLAKNNVEDLLHYATRDSAAEGE